MLLSQRIRQSIAQGFLLAYNLTLLNGIVFRHAHKLSSGKVITHAHPYKKAGQSNSPFQPNDHTSNELFLLDSFSNALFVGLTLSVALAAVKIIQVFFPSFNSYYLLTAYRTPFFGNFSLRGPPVLFC